MKPLVDKCLTMEGLYCHDQMQEVYEPNIEELSSHPVHLVNSCGQVMPSAFSPYCWFGTEMENLGTLMENFTYPVCNAFTPVLMEGKLCYELDTDKIKESAKPGSANGLVLLLDVSLDRSVIVKQSIKPILPMVEIKSKHITKLVIKKKRSASNIGPSIYIHTVQPFKFDRMTTQEDQQYTMTSLKHMTGTENFLALPDKNKKCRITLLQECKQQQFVETLQRKCGCVPYGLGIIMTKLKKTEKVNPKKVSTVTLLLQGMFCSPAGTECYHNLATNYSCLPSCIGLYADITGGGIENDIFREHREVMQKEYQHHKDSYGPYIPFMNTKGLTSFYA